MYDKGIDWEAVNTVAEGLSHLRDKVIFVGGATIGLYIDDSAADELRPTEDIDLTINMGDTYVEEVYMEQQLINLGFSPDASGPSIVRYNFKSIAVDIIPVNYSTRGMSNRWYALGYNDAQFIQLSNGIEIKILSAPFFLATKFEAFNDRGNGTDYYASHDFEDIIYFIDNRTTVVQEILESPDIVKNFLKEEIEKILSHPNSEEIISMHLNAQIQGERYLMIKEKLDEIVQG